MGDRETSTLSGGELQRLAVAAALARKPALLVSDESTAMLDPPGREGLMRLLRTLADDGLGIVHVTHDPAEAAVADRVVALDGGRIVDLPPPRPVAALPAAPPLGGHLVEVAGVGVVYDEGTPWAHRALHPVDLHIARGEALLVVGANGSGKSTLAWALASLQRPTEGGITVGGRPQDAPGLVAMAFQHARLQLVGPTVRTEVMTAAAVPADRADAALEAVGLSPDELGDRRLDELSGGQQRRLALAALLARDPQVLVLDEPFAGLDPEGRAGLVSLLGRLRARGLTLVVVSHDREPFLPLVDRVVTLADGRIVDEAPGGAQRAAGRLPRPPHHDPRSTTAATSGSRRLRFSEGRLPLLRPLPGTTPVHRLWAGTKLLVLAGLAVALSWSPTWPVAGVTAALVALAWKVARVPASARPRLPLWLLASIGVGAVFALLAGGKPEVDVGGVTIGFGGLELWAQFMVVAIVLVAAALVVSFTTALADVAPSLASLGRPLRWLRLPVDEWAVSIALAVRSFPLLLDEGRTLLAARRLRAPLPPPEQGQRRRSTIAELFGLFTTGLVVALRRGREMGEAIEHRGGAGRPPRARVRVHAADAAALVAAVGVVALAVLS
jgi:energy-coupling factor transport system ATP-binding protein